MGNKFMRRMVTMIVALAMVMTSGVFAFADSPTKGKVTSVSSVGSQNEKTLNVSWKADPAAEEYTVKVSGTGGSTKTVSGTSAKFTLKPGKTYTITVTPKNGTAKTGVKRFMRTTKITSVKSAGSKKLTVKWKKAKGATKYKVYMYKNGKWTVVKNNVKGTKATVKVPKKGTYKFRVRPVKGSYIGIYSKTKSGKAK